MKEIDFEVTLENTEDDIKRLYIIVRPDIKPETIQYSEFKEGVINSIVQLDDPISKDPIVIRTYMLKMKAFKKASGEDDGFDLEKFGNRKLELAALKKASEEGITVKLIATYKNGFIYKYIDGEMNTVELYDLESTAKRTAIKMARMHQFKLPEASERPIVFKFVEGNEFDQFTKEFNKKQQESKHEELRTVLPLYTELQSEYKKLHYLVLEKGAYGPQCFCHNDLHQENLLIEKKTKEPIFIDFEWSDTNFQMYDISMHLCCFGGIFCKYFKPENIPNDRFIRRWLEFYYEESKKLQNIQMSDKEFTELIDNELKKVLVNMLLIRLTLVTRSLFFELGNYDEKRSEFVKNYCMAVWHDYVKHKDAHLALLDTLKN